MSASLIRSLLRGDERFAVTGASGWLGRTALELLATVLGSQAFSSRVSGFASVSKRVPLRNGMVVPLRPLADLGQLDRPVTHVLHFAYQTREQVAKLGLGRYAVANLEITTRVLDAVQRHRPRGVLAISSGAVYAPSGAFDLDFQRNPYGSLKYQEELVLRRIAGDLGVRSVVARVFSTGGAYITKPDLYVLGDLILRALAGATLVLRASGPVYRSYCAAVDVITISLACLLAENSSDDLIFDTGGTVVEVGELAELVRVTLGLPHLAVERSMDPDARPDSYVGDGKEMAALASMYGLRLQSLDEQIRDTAAYLEIQPERAATR